MNHKNTALISLIGLTVFLVLGIGLSALFGSVFIGFGFLALLAVVGAALRGELGEFFNLKRRR